jgi:hypothetical protein
MYHTPQHMVSFDIIVLKDFSREQDFGGGGRLGAIESNLLIDFNHSMRYNLSIYPVDLTRGLENNSS